MLCPRCGATLTDGTKFCTTCGSSTASGAAMATAPSAGGFAAAAAAPSALPKAHREGDKLIVPKVNPVLPAFCVKCGQPSTTTLRRKITWMNPFIYLLCLFGLIGIIIAVILQATIGKKIELDVPLCDADKSARMRNIWIGVALTFLVPIVLPILASFTDNSGVIVTAILLAVVSFFAGIIIWSKAFSAIAVVKVDDVQGTFKASPQFLEKLG